MSPAQYRLFKDTLVHFIQTDKRTALLEWCLFQRLRHYLDPEFIKVKASRPRHRSLKAVEKEVQIVLSVLAHQGSGNPQSAFRRCADSLGFAAMTLKLPHQGDIARFSRSVHTLAGCYPLLKPRLLKAMSLAGGDGVAMEPVEREIICSVAAVMDCPVPSCMALTVER